MSLEGMVTGGLCEDYGRVMSYSSIMENSVRRTRDIDRVEEVWEHVLRDMIPTDRFVYLRLAERIIASYRP